MLAAAGSGQRLGAGGPKALVEVARRPLAAWSLAALGESASVAGIVVAAPPGHEEALQELAPDAVVIAGGATRAESVSLALERVEGDVVAVHDAARPLLTPELVDRLVARLVSSDADAVIAAAPIVDTLKRAGEGDSIAGTVSREGLWGAQTPQVFGTEALRAAQASARESGALEAATDEAALIEWMGGTVLLEPSEGPNLKVTDPADLRVAEALLMGRG